MLGGQRSNDGGQRRLVWHRNAQLVWRRLLWLAGADGDEKLADPRKVGNAGRAHLEGLASDLSLEALWGVVGDNPAVVDHGDVVRQCVSFVQVLGGE